jgi:hypothetical protein
LWSDIDNFLAIQKTAIQFQDTHVHRIYDLSNDHPVLETKIGLKFSGLKIKIKTA